VLKRGSSSSPLSALLALLRLREAFGPQKFKFRITAIRIVAADRTHFLQLMPLGIIPCFLEFDKGLLKKHGIIHDRCL
jgi:hypothetical protein